MNEKEIINLCQKYHDRMESQLAAGVYKDLEFDCKLCAEKPDLCPYCEGYKPEVNEDIKEFFEHCCKMPKLEG